MDDLAFKFISEILGESGAKVLCKAIEQEPALEHVLVPRTALAWISSRGQYEGPVPGHDNSYISFKKSEEGYSGVVTLDELNYKFEGVSQEHVAAACSAAVKAQVTGDQIRDVILRRLGKSIDALAKAHAIAKKIVPPKSKEELEKTDLPGMTAKPQKQLGFQEPEQPAGQTTGVKQAKPKLPKIPTPKTTIKMPSLSVGKSESNRECPACDGVQFKDGKFVGCICFKDLKKSSKTTVYGDGYVVDFTNDSDPDLVLELIRVFEE